MLKESLNEFVVNCLTGNAITACLLISSAIALTACQTKPVIQQNRQHASAAMQSAMQSSQVNSNDSSKTAATAYQPLSVNQVVSVDGFRDITWELVSLNSKLPQVFINKPYLYLQNATQTISGSTGCNLIDGQFKLQPNNNIILQAKAGHDNCGEALAQEADIMDLLARVKTYQVQEGMLYLYDQQGQLLMTAKIRKS